MQVLGRYGVLCSTSVYPSYTPYEDVLGSCMVCPYNAIVTFVSVDKGTQIGREVGRYLSLLIIPLISTSSLHC